MRLSELQNVTAIEWSTLSNEEVELLWSLHEDEWDPEGLAEVQTRERVLEEELLRAGKNGKYPKDDLIYVALGNACCKDDYLRLVARYGTPANRDLDHNYLQEYEALCEAVYRVGALLAYGEGFGEFEDISEIVEMAERHPDYQTDFTIPASVDLIVRIPDYRRAILPYEIRVEDINDAYWPPMFNPIRFHKWEMLDGAWYTHGVMDHPERGMRQYRMTVQSRSENKLPNLSDAERRFFCAALAREIANEQVRDMQLTFYDGEVDLYDSLSACDPPVWRLVWIALCMAEGKFIPSICRTCGKLIDRRGERRSKTVSCNEKTRTCTAAFNNNGKRRMIKRAEWGRQFKPDEHFSYIADYRDAVLEKLKDQKSNPAWPPLDC